MNALVLRAIGVAILTASPAWAAPPAASPSPAAPPAEHVITGELVRVHLPRRSFFLKTGRPAREVEIKVDEASLLWSDGRRVPLRDLHPGDAATVACADAGTLHRARVARFTATGR